MSIGIIISIVLFFLIVMAASMFLFIQVEEVPEAHIMIVERFNSFSRIAPPGLHILFRFLHERPREVYIVRTKSINGKVVYERVKSPYLDLRIQILDFPEIQAITKENVPIKVDALIFYEIVDPLLAAYRIANIPDGIEQLAETSLNEHIGKYELDAAIEKKSTIEAGVIEEVQEKARDWGIRVANFEIQRITPPPEMLEAMEASAVAERKGKAQLIEADAYRRAVERRAEGDKNALITRAEGEKQAAILKAEGEAQATVKIASAEGEAIRSIIASIMRADPDMAMRYLVAIKYIETLEKISESKSSKIFFPVELMGSVDRISEVLYKISKKKEDLK